MTSLTVIILTFNEQLHIERCIRSVQQVAQRIIVVDSFSSDQTLEIARSLGAEIFQHPFVHQGQQFQWALDNIEIDTEWIMRMDADEYILPELATELQEWLPQFPPDITGLGINRRVFFMDKWIRRGYYPMVLLRVWRKGAAYIEQKWMDEHIRLLYGDQQTLQFDMVDHNLNNLTWWTAKHNSYSTREAAERLDQRFHFRKTDTQGGVQKQQVKWYKRFYLQLPLFVRPFLYFYYRYVLRLGILEGKPGLIWHILQGFWFQFLVDAKIYQIQHLARKTGRSIPQVLEEDFNIKLQ